MIKTLKSYAEAVIELFYPTLCISCENKCDQSDELFCFRCQSLQSPTNLHLFKENEFTDHFRGRVNVHTAAALYYYTPGGIVHKLLEQIKYKSKPQVANRIGKYYGQILKDNPLYHEIDLIIAVPLHQSKLVKRGYNQSEVFGRSIAEAISKEFRNDILFKSIKSQSQTEMSRVERLNNMNNAFYIKNKEKLLHKNVLLVDDVMTTGATLEACATEILKSEINSISFLTIAIGK